MAYLELDRVSKQFGVQTVVDDFSLAVGKGEFVSFLGPSGCGKTTTLQMIAAFLDPTRGVIRPNVLLLDEPLSNLDAKLREEMQIELRQIQRNLGTTTILVTHDQNEAMSLSDRIVVMSHGRIEQIGTPQQTYERPASAFVSQFLGKTNDFAATIDRTGTPARLVAGSWSAPAPAGFNGPVTISVRPERVGFGDAGLSAKIVTRIF